MECCIVGIEPPNGPVSQGKAKAPRIGFFSLASLAAVLSDSNCRLLRLIYDKQPKTLAELAELSGRKVSNLVRTCAPCA